GGGCCPTKVLKRVVSVSTYNNNNIGKLNILRPSSMSFWLTKA
ncbi:MAG: hypothetical protein ACI8RD_002565, partial [Bacillariaceae sp.]